MTTRVITLWRVHVTSLTMSMSTTSVSTMYFRIEIMFILKATKSHFKGSYDKQNLTLVIISMYFHIEIMFILKATKSHFKGSYDKQNLTQVVISYEIYETRRNDPSCKILYL